MRLSVTRPDAMPKPRDPREQDVAYVPGAVDEAKAFNRAERLRNGLDPETGKPLDTLTTLVGELERFTAANPGVVVEFVRRPQPPAPQAELPSDTVNSIHAMQLAESVKVAAIAAALARVLHGVEFGALTQQDKATCQFLGCHALRAAQPHWKREAETRAREAGVHALKTQCGAAFRHLPEKQLSQIANVVWMHMRAAYTRITEGTEYLEPGTYQRIVKGQQ